MHPSDRFDEARVALSRIAHSPHPRAAWARRRIDRLYAGEPLTMADVRRITVIEVEAFAVSRIDARDPNPEYAERLARRAIPLVELLGLTEREPRRAARPRRRLPIG